MKQKFTPGLTFGLDLHDWLQSNTHQIRWVGKCGPTCIEWDSVLFTEAENDEIRELIRRANLAPELYDTLRGLFEHCAVIHKHWGDNSNAEEARQVIDAARALLARIEGGSE